MYIYWNRGCTCWSVVTLMTSDVWSDMYVYWNRECTCWSVVTLMTSDVWSMSQDDSQVTLVFICTATAYRSYLSFLFEHPVYVYQLKQRMYMLVSSDINDKWCLINVPRCQSTHSCIHLLCCCLQIILVLIL